MEVRGGKIDSVAMAVSLTDARVAKLRSLLLTWPQNRRYALEAEVRELVGTLLYASEVLRPGNFFVRRIHVTNVALPPVMRRQEKLGRSRPRSRKTDRLSLGPEVHSGVGSWWLMMSEDPARLGSHLSSLLHTVYLQLHYHTLGCDAPGTAVGGYCLETGAWWGFNLAQKASSRLSEHVEGHSDLFINIFEMIGMVVTGWALITGAGSMPRFGAENVLMLGNSMATVHWMSKGREGERA